MRSPLEGTPSLLNRKEGKVGRGVGCCAGLEKNRQVRKMPQLVHVVINCKKYMSVCFEGFVIKDKLLLFNHGKILPKRKSLTVQFCFILLWFV